MTLKNDGWWDEEDKQDFQVPTSDRQGWLHIPKNKNILAKYFFTYNYI